MRGIQVLLALVVAVVLADVVRATCPNGCGFGAVCDKKEKGCVCRSGREGNPDFLCFPTKFYYSCSIVADPMLTTTDKQDAGIKMPASLSLTELTTRRFGLGRGTCKITLNAWTKRFGGKYFIQNMEFKLIQKKIIGAPMGQTFRIFSKVVNNQYFWTVYEWKLNKWFKFLDITPATKRPVTKVIAGGCKIQFIRIRSNFLITNVLCCAFRFAIRPHNEKKPDVVPGVYLLARKWAQLNSLPEGLCNNGTKSPQIDDLKDEYGFNSRTQFTTFTGLSRGRPLVYQGAFPGLAAIQTVLKNCPKKKAGQFMVRAEFLFNFERLIACEKEKIMLRTLQLAKFFCKKDVAACKAAVAGFNTDCPDVVPNKLMKAFLKDGCS